MTTKPSEVDDEGLSPQERAALNGDDDETQSLANIANGGGDDADASDADDEDDDEEEDEEEEGSPAGDANPDAAAADKAKGDDAAPGAEEPSADGDDDDEAPVALPTLKVEVPADAADQVKALKAEKRELFAKYNAGDIDENAYQEQLEAADDKLDVLRKAMDAAELNKQITEANEKAVLQQWHTRVVRFMDDAAKEGIDYRKNVPLGAALDATVKALANEKDADGNLVHAQKPQSWFLRTAHAKVKESFGIKPAAGEKPSGDKGKKGGKAPDLSGLPPNINRAPAAAAGDDGGEFAKLDGLSGMELENAVARMTPAQQERWALQE